ncbi:hypothetical protein LOD99_6507 [Oopsacas minuta]|uniref:Metal-dependent HD superfamily phosphohydrolase n=1 Tax=Oopsacas minuta TaxID=111878 RepID=A0AAV7JLX1_9METZ|nr:hypothetical protein LOD99_6507 [Oopsacas minuta]
MLLAISFLIILIGYKVFGWNESNQLDIIWKEFIHKYSIDDNLSNQWLELIKTHYREPQRHYHTLKHIEEMLNLFLLFRDKLDDPDTVFLAIIFHDIIYNPRAVDNEELSAVEFERFYQDITRGNYNRGKLAVNNTLVSQYILETKTHSVSPSLATDSDLLLFLDFDMAILGTKERDYVKYSEQIRTEYQHIPLVIYTQRRSEVLKGFLEYQWIYNTDWFKISHEKTARANIAREISYLSQLPEENKQDL